MYQTDRLTLRACLSSYETVDVVTTLRQNPPSKYHQVDVI